MLLPLRRSSEACSELTLPKIRHELDERGIYRIDDVDVGLDPGEFLLRIARDLGTVVPQRGKEVAVLRPREGAASNGPFGMGVFPMHTDALVLNDSHYPDFVLMLCINPGIGGDHFVSDGLSVIQGLRRQIDGLGDILTKKQIKFVHPGTEMQETDGMVVLPIAPRIEPAENLYEGPILDEETGYLRFGTSVMKRVDERLEQVATTIIDRAYILDNVRRDTLWIIDNKRMLHGRGEIFSRDRLMLKVWVKIS